MSTERLRNNVQINVSTVIHHNVLEELPGSFPPAWALRERTKGTTEKNGTCLVKKFHITQELALQAHTLRAGAEWFIHSSL